MPCAATRSKSESNCFQAAEKCKSRGSNLWTLGVLPERSGSCQIAHLVLQSPASSPVALGACAETNASMRTTIDMTTNTNVDLGAIKSITNLTILIN